MTAEARQTSVFVIDVFCTSSLCPARRADEVQRKKERILCWGWWRREDFVQRARRRKTRTRLTLQTDRAVASDTRCPSSRNDECDKLSRSERQMRGRGRRARAPDCSAYVSQRQTTQRKHIEHTSICTSTSTSSLHLFRSNGRPAGTNIQASSCRRRYVYHHRRHSNVFGTVKSASN